MFIRINLIFVQTNVSSEPLMINLVKNVLNNGKVR
jgi:hypothetical protein